MEEKSNLNQIKLKFKTDKKDLKFNLNKKIKDKSILPFEKDIEKENYHVTLALLKQDYKDKLKKTKNIDKYNIDVFQKSFETELAEQEKENIKKIFSIKRKIKKIKINQKKWLLENRNLSTQDKKNHIQENQENINDLNHEILNIKTGSKVELRQKKQDYLNENKINNKRVIINSSKVKLASYHTRMMPVLGKIANQRHLMSIRNAFSSLIPFIMIASFITVIRSIPTNLDPNVTHAYLYSYFPKNLDNALVMVSNLTMGIMALGLSIAIGINLGQSYGEAPLMSAAMGMLGFVLWVGPQSFNVNGSDALYLPIANLGSQGLFVSLLMSMAMVEIYRIFKKYNITIRLPKSVPPAVGNSFMAIIPALVYAAFVLCIRFICNFDLIIEITNILKPFGNLLSDNFGAVVFIVLLNSLFWWFGIHGSAITGTITYPFWYSMIAENQDWWNNGHIGHVPHQFVEPFYQWTIWIGGSGSTIGLAIASMLFSKSKQNKALSKATIVPAVFNISEPMMFGFPVVLNIYLFIPFMIAPVITGVVSLIFIKIFAISWVVVAPWTMPAPIGAFLASGNNYGAIIAALASIVVATLIYIPFYKAFDKTIVKKEREFIKIESEKLGLSVYDYMKQEALKERR